MYLRPNQDAKLADAEVAVEEATPYEVKWRGEFTSSEANALHAEAFGTRVFSDEEWDWRSLVERHSLGWVVARDASTLVGFVNVIYDGFVHAWLQDTMVASAARGSGIGTRPGEAAKEGAATAGCEWMHVDFDDNLRSFYFDACGFTPTNAGLIHL